jgi:hypothetical protein
VYKKLVALNNNFIQSMMETHVDAILFQIWSNLMISSAFSVMIQAPGGEDGSRRP